jgi:hypothetical protein
VTRSGDQVLFEAIIRSLPARRRLDEQLTAWNEWAQSVRRVGESLGAAMRNAIEAIRPLAQAIVTLDQDAQERP